MLVRFLFLVLLIFISCKEKEQQRIYKISISKELDYSPIWIAIEKKLFEKKGIPIKVLEKKGRDVFLDNSFDFICAEFSDSIMLNSEMKPLKIIYRLNYNSKNDIILSNKSIKKVKDLKNKKIAFNGINSSSHLFVRQVLFQRGIKEGEYFADNLEFEEIISSLKNGKIDAGHVKYSYLTEDLLNEFNIIAKAGDVPDFLTGVISIDKRLEKNEKEIIFKFLEAIGESVEFLRTEKEESINILSSKLELNKNQVERELDNFYFLSLNENLKSLKNENSNIMLNPGEFQPGQFTESSKGTLFISGEEIIKYYSHKGQFFIDPKLKDIIESKYISGETEN